MVRDTESFNGLLIGMYTRPTMTETSRGLSATAELLVQVSAATNYK